MDKQVPALPLTLKLIPYGKHKKLIIEYGKYAFKLKPLADGTFSGLLITKFLWDVTQELWNAQMQREEQIADVKKSLLGIDDKAADNVVRRIHEDLFGEG